ncbi:MAG: GH116 family glycosyl hydrolase [Opitutales bacterium]
MPARQTSPALARKSAPRASKKAASNTTGSAPAALPEAETMRREHKARSGTALGGIGTGGCELLKDGTFRNWNAFNNQPLFTGPMLPFDEQSNLLFFVVRYQVKGQTPKMKILQIDEGHMVGAIPTHVYEFPWLSGVEQIDYQASYPFTRLVFTDQDMPFDIELVCWHPFIPHNAKDSGLPGFYCDFTVTAKGNQPVDVLLTTSWRNCAGYAVEERIHKVTTKRDKAALRATMTADKMDATDTSWGTQTLLTAGASSTYYVGWEHRHPYYEIFLRSAQLPDINDTKGRNSKNPKTGKLQAGDRLWSTVGKHARLTRKGQRFKHSFIVAWHFPNLYAGLTPREMAAGKTPPKTIEGHAYANFLKDSAAVANYLLQNRKRLLEQSRRFHDAFYDSSLPHYVLSQINSNLTTFTFSSWYTREGDFGIQEGLLPDQRKGPVATVDVGLYGSIATAALFPELDQQMMRVHQRIQKKNGEISHAVPCNFHIFEGTEHVHSRLDLPSQFTIMAIRAYFFSGDRAYLEGIWPAVTQALNYVHRERDKDGDGLPDMEGAMCTYDNFPMYGPSSYVAGLWLSALTYAIEAAKVLGDSESEVAFAEWLQRGERVFEEKLWNGEYYDLYNDVGGQIRGDRDAGCLTDQLIGQFTNHQCGLRPLLAHSAGRKKKALRAILKRNYRDDLGLANCQWPGDVFYHDVDPDCWNDQANTVWTGVELAFASFLLYEGMPREALKIIRNVDERYRREGRYFDHQEFGGHYFRPMSAWGILNGALGLAIREDIYTFAPKIEGEPLRLFFAHGAGTAHYERTTSKNAEKVAVVPVTGTFRAKVLNLELASKKASVGTVRVRAGGKALPVSKLRVDASTAGAVSVQASGLRAKPGERIEVQIAYA